MLMYAPCAANDGQLLLLLLLRVCVCVCGGGGHSGWDSAGGDGGVGRRCAYCSVGLGVRGQDSGAPRRGACCWLLLLDWAKLGHW